MYFRILAAVLLALCFFAQPASAQKFQADSNINIYSHIVVNNTTAVVVRNRYANLYGITASNNSATPAYVKLYNATSATCGSGTPVARFMIPIGAGGGTVSPDLINGIVFTTGITMCVTTGIADNDTAAPAASAYLVNLYWK